MIKFYKKCSYILFFCVVVWFSSIFFIRMHTENCPHKDSVIAPLHDENIINYDTDTIN